MSTAPVIHLRHSSTVLPVVGSEQRVPTVFGEWLDVANFDHGASTPALLAVADAVERATTTYSSVHRGKGWNSRVSSALYEAARAEVATFVGAREDDEVIFTRNTTDSFNLLARALPRPRPLAATAETGAARFEAHGWLRQGAANLWRQARFLAGADPDRLARGYRK